MDLVIFTGSLSEDELRHERAAQYERLTRTGELDGMVVQPPAEDARRRSLMYGAAGLTIGLGLVVLILYAVVR
jgi:hypothetical protein